MLFSPKFGTLFRFFVFICYSLIPILTLSIKNIIFIFSKVQISFCFWSFGEKYCRSKFRDIDLLVGTVSNPAHHLLPSSDAEHGVSMERRNKILRYSVNACCILIRTVCLGHSSQTYMTIIRLRYSMPF